MVEPDQLRNGTQDVRHPFPGLGHEDDLTLVEASVNVGAQQQDVYRIINPVRMHLVAHIASHIVQLKPVHFAARADVGHFRPFLVVRQTTGAIAMDDRAGPGGMRRFCEVGSVDLLFGPARRQISVRKRPIGEAGDHGISVVLVL